ncbi:MAG: hypothetical protein LQ345_005106 [Seirophora villosa]|nr:MAG: hypothetical protein LQ345_005106 [Seirophora villosa]
MAVWNTTPYLFLIIAGSIVGFILFIGVIGIIMKYRQDVKRENDVEANQALPESNPPPQLEMAAVEREPSKGPGEIRRNTAADPAFNPGEYVKVEDSGELDGEV